MPDYIPTFGERDFTPADTYRGQSNLQASPLETTSSTFGLNYGTGTTQAAAALFVEHQDNTGTMLSPEQQDIQNKQLGITGLHSDQPVNQATLSLQQERQKEYLANKEIVDNGSGFASTAVGQFGIGLGASFLDPIDFALNFVGGGLAEKLGVGAKALQGASIGSRALTRLSQGAIDNLPVNTGISAANWYESSQEQRDFGLNDFVKSIAYGEVMGSVIHSATGAIGDIATREGTNTRIRDILPPNAQTEALQLSNQSVYNFNDILGIQPKVIAAESFLGKDLNQGERIALLQRKVQETEPEPVNFPLSAKERSGQSGELLSGRQEDFSYLPTDSELNSVHPEDIAKEKVTRLKDLLNGHNYVTTNTVDNSQNKVTLSSDTITSGNIDDEISDLEKQNEDLNKQIQPEEKQNEQGTEATGTKSGKEEFTGNDSVVGESTEEKQAKAKQHLSDFINTYPEDERDFLLHHINHIHESLLNKTPEELNKILEIQEQPNPIKGEKVAKLAKGKVNLVTALDEQFHTPELEAARKRFFDKRLNANEVDVEKYEEHDLTQHPIIDPTGDTRESYDFDTPEENEMVARMNDTLAHKLEEAKLAKLHDAKSLEEFDIHDPIQREDLDKLDSHYGKDNWVIKPFDKEIASQGKGIFFPESLKPALEGKEAYANRSYKDFEKAGLSKEEAQKAILPEKFMVQKRLHVRGETKELRESGVSVLPGEYRIHIWTDENGEAHVVKGATFEKDGVKAVGVDTEDSLSAEKEAKEAVMRLPKENRINTIFGPDVASLRDGGHATIELNPTDSGGTTGWLDFPHAQDALVSSLRGESPAHVKFAQEQLHLLKGEEPKPKEVVKPEPKVTLPEMINHTPEYGEEGNALIKNSEAQVTEADKTISELPIREQAIRNATNCFLNAV